MAFDTFGFLEVVNSLDRVRQSAATACTVYETDTRGCITATFTSGIFDKETMDFVEHAFGIPVSPFVIHRLPVLITFRQKSPLTTAAQKIENRLENTDGIMLSFAFHKIRKESYKDAQFSPVNLRDMDERIIIFLYQVVV